VQINNGVADICNKIQILQTVYNHVSNNAGWDFRAAHALEGGFDFPQQSFNIGSRNRALGAGDTDAASQFLAVKFFAGAIPLDQQGSGQDGALNGRKTLLAIKTLSAPTDTTVGVVSGIQYF
jgi:hypothetical protein